MLKELVKEELGKALQVSQATDAEQAALKMTEVWLELQTSNSGPPGKRLAHLQYAFQKPVPLKNCLKVDWSTPLGSPSDLTATADPQVWRLGEGLWKEVS